MDVGYSFLFLFHMKMTAQQGKSFHDMLLHAIRRDAQHVAHLSISVALEIALLKHEACLGRKFVYFGTQFGNALLKCEPRLFVFLCERSAEIGQSLGMPTLVAQVVKTAVAHAREEIGRRRVGSKRSLFAP